MPKHAMNFVKPDAAYSKQRDKAGMSSISELEARLANALQRIDEASKDLIESASKDADKQPQDREDLNAYKHQIEQLTLAYEEKAKAHAALEDAHEGFVLEIENLKADKTSLEENLEIEKNALSSLKGQNADLQDAVETLKETQNTLNQKLQEELEDLKAARKAEKAELEDIIRELKHATSSAAMTQEELD